MTLIFRGETNDQDVWIDNIIFRLSNGDTAIISRTITTYVVEDGKLKMKWWGCHLVRPGKKNDYSLGAKDLNGAEIVAVNCLADAPNRYFVKITEWKAENDTVNRGEKVCQKNT